MGADASQPAYPGQAPLPGQEYTLGGTSSGTSGGITVVPTYGYGHGGLAPAVILPISDVPHGSGPSYVATAGPGYNTNSPQGYLPTGQESNTTAYPRMPHPNVYPPTIAPYPPNATPFPTNVAPYPTNTTPYPPTVTPYPPNTVSYPANTTPYPPNTTPYPPNTTPYPPNTTPYPTYSTHYPPNNIPYPSNPQSADLPPPYSEVNPLETQPISPSAPPQTK